MNTDELRKVLVIGLDCAPPELIFHRFRDDLPTIRHLMQTGVYGPLNSTIPPITVPAWMSMMTGKDPGTLGFYGLRNRADYSYTRLSIANATLVNDDTVWDILSACGEKSHSRRRAPNVPAPRGQRLFDRLVSHAEQRQCLYLSPEPESRNRARGRWLCH